MSPQTTVVFFLGVLAAFCLGLEFEERGEFEVKLVVNSNARWRCLTVCSHVACCEEWITQLFQ